LSDFESLLSSAGLRLRQSYGNYDLSSFNAKSSKRLILIAEKP